MSTYSSSPTVAVRPSTENPLRRRLGRLLHTALALILTSVALTGAGAHAAAATPDIAGTCTFGPTSGTAPLTLQMTASTIDITGYGSCTDNAGTSVLNLALGGYGTFTCAGGVGSTGGQAIWSTNLPAAQPALLARVVVSGSTVTLEIEGSSGFFEATADLATTNATAQDACLSTGTVSSPLAGTMTFASS